MSRDAWANDLAWEIVTPTNEAKNDYWVDPSPNTDTNSWGELDADLKKVQENLGADWSYDKWKNIFRNTAGRPWFTFNPNTDQYHDEKEGLFYDWNKHTESFEEAVERKSTKLEYVKNFKRSMKEFLDHFSNTGLPRSQLLESITRLRVRAVEGYQNEKSKISVSAKLQEATEELLRERTGSFIDTKGKKVHISPPYTCPLCGRTTSDPDTMLAHVKLHEYCSKHGMLSAEAKRDPNATVERLLHSEAIFVVGNKDVQTAVEMAVNLNGANNQKRYKAYTYMKQWLGTAEHEDFSCDVIHAVRAAFPEAHGNYSGRHNCESFENKLQGESAMDESAPDGIFGYQNNRNFEHDPVFW